MSAAPAVLPPDVPLGSPPPGTTSDFSHPVDESRYALIIAICVIFTFLSTFCVLARVWSRVFVVRLFGWDDGFAVITLILNIGLTVGWAGEITTGISDYDWNVHGADWIANDEYLYYVWNGFLVITLYIAFATAKLSILMLYLRLLGPTHRTLRVYVWAMIICITVFNIGCIIALLKFCTPTAKLFNVALPGTCNRSPEVFFVQSVGQVIADFLILLPPIPVVWHLNTSRLRKIGFASILCTGFGVTAIGIVRTVFSDPINYPATKYALYGEFLATLWCIIEINLTIIVVCLPALTQLFRRVGGSRENKAMPVLPESPAGMAPSEESSVQKKRSPISRIINALYSGLDNEADQEKQTMNAADGSTTKHGQGSSGETSMTTM